MQAKQLFGQVGRVLGGRFRIIEIIGSGASAGVFLAEDLPLGRRVAVKVLHSALAGDQGFLRRFQNEARSAAGLAHPNIMRVLDWGGDENGPFLILEYLGGGSLRALLDRYGPLSAPQSGMIGLAASRALDYAHRRGLIHRDIKPANLLFDDEGRVSIADFGLAKALAEAALTEPGTSVFGTAQYCSPEQAKGDSLTECSDVYSLGLVLLEAATGKRPFARDTTIATLVARTKDDPFIPKELGELGEIIRLCTSMDPKDRPTAAELAKLLQTYLRSAPSAEPLKLPGATRIDIEPISDAETTRIVDIDREENAGLFNWPKTTDLIITNTEDDLSKKEKKPEPRFVDGVHPNFQDQMEDAKPKRRAMVAVGIVTAVIAAIIAGSAIYLNTGKEVELPQLVGISIVQARNIAEQSDLRLSVSEEFNEDLEKGIVISQTPDAGDKVRTRRPVMVVVSKGAPPREPPIVLGQSESDAMRAIDAAGFVSGGDNITTRFDEEAPAGQVLEQAPRDGKRDKGSAIKLVVSAGPKPRVIPDISGMTQEEVVAALTALQLDPKVVEGFSDSVPQGKLAGTRPAVGAQVKRGGVVEVVISKGPEMIKMPDVTGLSPEAATAKIESAGLRVTAVYGPSGATSVFSTTPAAGSSLKRGTSVSIYKR